MDHGRRLPGLPHSLRLGQGATTDVPGGVGGADPQPLELLLDGVVGESVDPTDREGPVPRSERRARAAALVHTSPDHRLAQLQAGDLGEDEDPPVHVERQDSRDGRLRRPVGEHLEDPRRAERPSRRRAGRSAPSLQASRCPGNPRGTSPAPDAARTFSAGWSRRRTGDHRRSPPTRGCRAVLRALSRAGGRPRTRRRRAGSPDTRCRRGPGRRRSARARRQRAARDASGAPRPAPVAPRARGAGPKRPRLRPDLTCRTAA